jgi:hypothetical protein
MRAHGKHPQQTGNWERELRPAISQHVCVGVLFSELKIFLQFFQIPNRETG